MELPTEIDTTTTTKMGTWTLSWNSDGNLSGLMRRKSI
jgi:hypothetical protein